MLTISQMLRELEQYKSLSEIANELEMSPTQVSQLLHENRPGSIEQISAITELFQNHVHSHSELVEIKSIFDLEGSSLLVNGADGFQPIKSFYVKKDRSIKKIYTSNHSIKCSNDHLIEADFGWAYSESLSIGNTILTISGYEEITSIEDLPIEPVFDFEVLHENQRYWGGTGISSHNSGKSFLLSNVMKNAQDDGAFILALDSENALDIDYLKRVGVDVSADKFMGLAVVTISDAVSTISDFIKLYEKDYGKYNKDAPKILIAVDSLDMLLTDSETENFNGGVQKGDQGQRAKQLKHFLRTVVSRIKALNITFIGTHQVYPADVLAGEGKWAINNAIRYSASQIALITRLKLKEDGEVTGIRMSVETFKSRFAKLGSKVEVVVPFDKGMNPNSGLVDMLESEGVIKKSGAWLNCEFPGEKPFSFQSTKMTDELVKKLLSHPKLLKEQELFESVIETPETPVEAGAEDLPITEVVDTETGEINPL